jgi:hypothetical protein
MQGVLRRVEVGKMPTSLLHPQSDDLVQRYIKTTEEDSAKVVASQHRDWETRLATFLLASRTSTHEFADWIPANLVFQRKPRLPCGVLHRIDLQSTMLRTLWIGCTTSTATHAKIWSWPATE